MRIFKIPAGKINRHRHQGQALLLPSLDILPYLGPYIAVKVPDKADPLKQRNKLAGAHEAILRVDPAHQRLCPHRRTTL